MSESQHRYRIAVLVTCFNRREMTLAALQRLAEQERTDDLELMVYLVDDASTDGSAEAVARAFPEVRLIYGDGALFWNGGMRVAFAAAMADGHDAYIWFNDDTMLAADALHRLCDCAFRQREGMEAAIVVGTVTDPVSGAATYGGVLKWNAGLRVRFSRVVPGEEPIACQTMNGNFTLVPDGVARRLGNLDGGFRHQFADWDYGLRATGASIPIVVAPGYFGTCSDNSHRGTWRDTSGSLRQRWKHLMSPKGTPPQEWLLYTRRHFGWRWPIYFVSPYVKTLVGM